MTRKLSSERLAEYEAYRRSEEHLANQEDNARAELVDVVHELVDFYVDARGVSRPEASKLVRELVDDALA